MPQMRSRREQVDAHKFITSRMNQALVLANPDSIERPLRRIGLSIFASVMVLALVFGGFAIATLFGKGNDEPEAGHIITIKGSNAVYVYTTKDGGEETEDNPLKLWQVTNYTSALLLVEPGSDGEAPVQDLKASSIAGVDRGGFTIGIEGIPSQPPDEEELLQTEKWNACSMPRTEGGTADFQLTQLVVADMEDPDKWLGDDNWLLAKTAGEETPTYYLIWGGKKYKVGDDPEEATAYINALGLTEDQAMPLNDSMLRTIPDGAPIEPPEGDGFDEVSDVLDTDGNPIKYGQPVRSGGEDDLYVLLKTEDGDEFAKISATMERVLASLYGGTADVDPSERSEVGSDASYMPNDYPTADLSGSTWSVDTEQPAVCAVYDPKAQDGESTEIGIAVYEAAPDTLTEAADDVEFTEEGEIFSDVENLEAQTVLPQGTAVLVDSRTDQGSTIEGFTYLVSDQGVRHGLVDDGETDSTQKMLGYANTDPISVPDSMISLITEGNALDPREARQQMYSDEDEVPVYESESPSEGTG